MASPMLQLVGGRDFTPGTERRAGAAAFVGCSGWPLSPQLLAALHNSDARTRWFAENAARNVLRMPLIYDEPAP